MSDPGSDRRAADDTAQRVVHAADGRRIGYRRMGEGPPVALLHASPRSSAVLVPLASHLARRFTVFAFDTPGFGWSEPLSMRDPDTVDLADALMEAFDALGIDRAPVYGSHTGAAIAVTAGWRHPDRVPALALDGYAIFTPTEQAEYLANYLAPLVPAWDGSHLAFLWSRVKDQFTTFPWYLLADNHRLPRPLLTADALQAVVRDFLAAGDSYRAAYAAAFAFDWVGGIGRVIVPTTVMARSDDLLFKDLGRLPPLRDIVQIVPLGEAVEPWADEVAAALSRGGIGCLGPEPPQVEPARSCRMSVVRVEGGTIALTRRAGPGDRPIVLLPGIPGSARSEAGLARALAAQRMVVTADLPGFGCSSLRDGLDAGAIARSIRDALSMIGVKLFDVVAVGESAAVGCLLADGAEAGLVLLDPVPDDEAADLAAAMVDTTPRRDGTHLLAAWHQLRDGSLWRPWFRATPTHAIGIGHHPDVERLQAIFTDWLLGGTESRRTLAAVFAQPLEALTPAGGNLRVILRPGHPWSAWSAALARRLDAEAREVLDERSARAAAILEMLALR